jgi:hypothetical protein
MICKKCNSFFQPTPEEERLIVAGATSEICTACAAKEWRSKVGPTQQTVIYPGNLEDMGHGNSLWHAAKFDAAGRQMSFVCLPPRPIKHVPNVLRKQRPWDFKVFVLSEKPVRKTTEPRVTLHTNLDRFRRMGEEFWVRKIPAFQDALTGMSHITALNTDVGEVTTETVPTLGSIHTHIKVSLKSGGYILIKYR